MAHRADLVLQPEYRGLLVVGDIHGHVDLMQRMMAHAARERLFFVSCGDLVDRGPSSAHCLLRMRDSVAAGAGAWIRGNHEDKLFRALKGRAVTISGALAATLAELQMRSIKRDTVRRMFQTVDFARDDRDFTGRFGGRDGFRD